MVVRTVRTVPRGGDMMAGNKESREERHDREVTSAYLRVLGGSVDQARADEAKQSDDE